ncbi:MAG: formate dehydrogenase accessory sulfurtransferase FdhD [Nannocystaceae bacterium]
MTGDDDVRSRGVARWEWRGDQATLADDTVAREEPLELRIAGVPIAVVMRTPGDDLELARGFLLTERIVAAPHEIASLRHCDRLDDPDAEDNILNVGLAPSVELDLQRLRRNLYASSSCGVCGKASIDAAMACAAPIDDAVSLSIDTLRALPQRLQSGQATFAATGGLHGAGLFDQRGTALVVREDVGRHNAIDKVIGWAAAHDRWPLSSRVLAVSGRVSFEVVQKALAARIPVVVAVSAPTSLAVSLAQRSNMTLLGFVRGDRACVYAGATRVQPA